MRSKVKDEQSAETRAKRSKSKSKSASKGLWHIFISLWTRSFIVMAVLIALIVIVLPIATFIYIKSSGVFVKEQVTFLEQVQSISEVATAEMYTKVIVEREDNEFFGKSIGVDLPGTKRQLLFAIPGSIRAGVDFSLLTEQDIKVNEEQKTVELSIPHATFLGEAEIFFDKVEVYSYEGLFREKENIEEAYELANEAERLIVEEASSQGVLEMAEQNAEKALKGMFSFLGYDVTILYKE